MKCFYHKSDLDGHCSGAIVRRALPAVELIGVDYNDKLNRDAVSRGELVFVVDFSFPAKDMEWLNSHSQLVWCDHHKSAIEKCARIDGIRGVREIGTAGCELTWLHLNPDQEMPLSVHLLGRYDVWDHRDSRVLPFQYGMRDQDETLPDAEIWPAVIEDESKVFEIIAHGETVLAYQTKQDAKYAKAMAYESDFHGLRALIMNKPFSSSKAFDSIYDPDRHDIMILFGVKSGEFKYSLYSGKDSVDVSSIAVQYGGGGHKGAAGFYSKKQVV
jgi:oligoribonuclease NrnB/cAMP/cGMP phosphodiesterase (DHH superfamily)